MAFAANIVIFERDTTAPAKGVELVVVVYRHDSVAADRARSMWADLSGSGQFTTAIRFVLFDFESFIHFLDQQAAR
jgi:hypothetical protein